MKTSADIEQQATHLSSFKAYDIRGRVPDELNEEVSYRIGRAYASFLKPSKIVIGRDIRLSSEAISSALSNGLTDSGVDVFDIGICGTEQVYFATFNERMDGGIMVTASHNPIDYNGMKLVREGAKPISGDSGLKVIEEMVRKNISLPAGRKGTVRSLDINKKYIEHLLGYIDIKDLKPFKVVVNAGNGGAGKVIDLLENHLPFSFIKINHEPDGTFPNGVPNPLLPENRNSTVQAIIEHKADLGIAWDGDFDRCFFFDEKGNFIEGYYIVGLLSSAILAKHPNEKIIHDPRLTWNTIDIVLNSGGIPVMSKTGHAFIKERMRSENAVYGGEMSAHHYFKEFAYCDSGMIPWLMVLDIMGKTGRSLSDLVEERIRKFPASGEINRTINATDVAIKEIKNIYEKDAVSVDYADGLSMEFPKWRFNLRCSNTEPVLRLNVESRGDERLMRDNADQLLKIIDTFK